MTRIHREIVHVPMRDGVRLSGHIHRPTGKTRVPTILMYTPYRKGPLGKPHPIVQHGYATVTFDVRGTGSKQVLGQPMRCDHVLDLSGISGIVEYAPEELVVTLRAGTYVMKDGPLIVDQSAAMSGTDVAFYFTGNKGGLLFDKKTTVSLSASMAEQFTVTDRKSVV